MARLQEFEEEDIRRKSMLALDNQMLLDIEQKKFTNINQILGDFDEKSQISDSLPNISIKYDKIGNLSSSDHSF